MGKVGGDPLPKVRKSQVYLKTDSLQKISYDGPAIQRTRDGNILVQTSGRIIIDADTFCKQWDQCKIYTRALNSTDSSDAKENPWDNPVTNDNTELTLKDNLASADARLTDYQYMLCTPLLRGYSLKSKKWRKEKSSHPARPRLTR